MINSNQSLRRELLIYLFQAPEKLGIWAEVNNRSYLFSFPNNTKMVVICVTKIRSAYQTYFLQYKDALLGCCSVGMKLISLHQVFLFDSLSKALKGFTYLN
jgi:hypothetical protein